MIQTKCCKCGVELTRIKNYKNSICFPCQLAHGKIVGKKYRDSSPLILMNCKICDSSVMIKKYKQKAYEQQGGVKCKECVRKINSQTMKKTQEKIGPEQRKINASLAVVNKTKEQRSSSVKKQWETIKNDKENYEQFCHNRSNRMKLVWEKYPTETKNKIVNAFCKSYGKSRSKSSDLLKEKMIESGIDGFISEEVFHGFVPDEINHDLKIIVEMYGDLYHCNPRKYKNPKQYITAIHRTVEEQWQRDKRRLACFYKHGYNVVVVWDSRFRQNPNREIERIKNAIDQKRNLVLIT